MHIRLTLELFTSLVAGHVLGFIILLSPGWLCGDFIEQYHCLCNNYVDQHFQNSKPDLTPLSDAVPFVQHQNLAICSILEYACFPVFLFNRSFLLSDSHHLVVSHFKLIFFSKNTFEQHNAFLSLKMHLETSKSKKCYESVSRAFYNSGQHILHCQTQKLQLIFCLDHSANLTTHAFIS